MRIKENEDLAHYFMTYLGATLNSENQDSADIANMATDMVKNILSEHPKIRHLIWQYGQENLLDKLGLDYGKE